MQSLESPEPNGAVSITNTSVTIVDHYSGDSAYCADSSGPSGQGRAVIRLQYDRHNRNSDIMDANLNQCTTQCMIQCMNAVEEDRARESQFAKETSNTRANRDGSVSGVDGTNASHATQATQGTLSKGRAGNATNASGNASHVGRGKHRVRQKRSATTTARADHTASLCATLDPLAAPVVPVVTVVTEPLPQPEPVSQSHSQTCDPSDSAFDNKAFSSDGDSPKQLKTTNPSVPRHDLSLTRNQRLFELSCDHSNNNCLTDRLINNESSLSSNCLKSDNKEKNCFMKTNNESDSSLKEQICSSGDNNVIRSRSTRSTRSSVVKHIGVFYSDLCDVIKAMRSGNQYNSNNNNNNNISSNLHTSSQSQTQDTNAANTRNSLSGPVVLQNEHLIGGSALHPQQQPQPTQSPYPVQPQSAITCLHPSPHQSQAMSANSTLRSPPQSPVRVEGQAVDLPDILNSHLPPPPYSTLPPQAIHLPPLSALPPIVERGRITPIRAPPPPPPPPPLPVAGRPPLPSRRILHAPTAVLAHCSRPNYLRPTCAVSETETSASKTCLSCNGLSIRWFILLIAFIGLLCAIIGTVLGALRSTGREHLTLALLMIGVGIILITVSGIAWRLTSSGPTWRSILGLHDLHPPQSLCNGSSINDTARRFVPRVPAPYGRTGTHHHPYGAMFYPEFQYRPPPPSYQASMQEYRLRLLLLDRSSHPQSTSLSPVSPPPTYRSSAASSLTGTLTRQSQCNTIQRAASRPPSYRQMSGVGGQALVSTTPSFQSSPIQSPQTGAPPLITATVTTTGVSSTLTTSQTPTQLLNQVKSAVAKAGFEAREMCHHDINRVTILQTTDTSQVCTPNGVNIVAISPTSVTSSMASTLVTGGHNPLMSPIVSSNEVQILAHV